ncbi:MAG TPA: protein kinase [Vicinamibacterales bacterium]|nr:protein kinase [Vicinamibacterales bacterium]
MSILPGTRIGPYEVVAAIGAGAMGEVFRARDVNLDRVVAIKILPAAFASDPERRSRLEREARVLASLNHPHIAQVYGIETCSTGPALVMELVVGRTLRDLLLSPDPLSNTQALSFARQIAAALDAAHEKGIVHRDLKPENVCVTAEGIVKVLDFGLAKSTPSDVGEGSEATTVVADTAIGSVLGTPGYMSPEQARGRLVDRRTDIWAFGCVLYELWVRRPPFRGDSVSDTIVAVLEREPDWSALPGHTPAFVRVLIRRCLEKDSSRRLRDIGDAVFDLSEVSELGKVGSRQETSARGAVAIVRHPLTLALAGCAVLFATTTGWLLLAGGPAQPAEPTAAPVRFELHLPENTRFGSYLPQVETTTLAFSPDGSRLAFIARGEGAAPRVWIRPLGDAEALPVTGTDGALSVFWSPDGRALGFFADGKLKRIDAAGGAAVQVCDVPGNLGFSGTWGVNNDILFASIRGEAVYRISTAGGTPTPIVNAKVGVNRVLWPWFLPDGRRFIYTELRTDLTGMAFLATLDGTATAIFPIVSRVVWVEPDLLLFVREGTLLGQRFDAAAGRATGDPFSVSDPVAYSMATGWAEFTASRHGMLALQSRQDTNRLVWFDRGGTRLADVGEAAGSALVRLSADDQRLLFSRVRPGPGTHDIWMSELSRQYETRLTSSPGTEVAAVWVPGRRATVFSAAAGGPPALTHRDLDTETERTLLRQPGLQFANDVTRDGKRVGYQQRTPLGDWDLMIVPIDEPSSGLPLFNSPFSEYDLRFSPDNRLVSFTSNESGRPEVYVARFPVTGGKTLVSAGGGTRARWRVDGRELFYVAGTNRMMVVPIGDNAPRAFDEPRGLFTIDAFGDYDVARDGRFIIVVPAVREQPVSVMLNWQAAIRR